MIYFNLFKIIFIWFLIWNQSWCLNNFDLRIINLKLGRSSLLLHLFDLWSLSLAQMFQLFNLTFVFFNLVFSFKEFLRITFKSLNLFIFCMDYFIKFNKSGVINFRAALCFNIFHRRGICSIFWFYIFKI